MPFTSIGGQIRYAGQKHDLFAVVMFFGPGEKRETIRISAEKTGATETWKERALHTAIAQGENPYMTADGPNVYAFLPAQMLIDLREDPKFMAYLKRLTDFDELDALEEEAEEEQVEFGPLATQLMSMTVQLCTQAGMSNQIPKGLPDDREAWIGAMANALFNLYHSHVLGELPSQVHNIKATVVETTREASKN